MGCFKSKHLYSWGPLYETMMEFSEPWRDPLFERAFHLFYKLDMAENIETVIELLEQYKFTEYELNRINSPCLDGLIAINDWQSNINFRPEVNSDTKWCYMSVIEFPRKDTFLYVLEKTQKYDLLLWHTISHNKVDLYNLYCDNISTNVSRICIMVLCQNNNHELLEKLLSTQQFNKDDLNFVLRTYIRSKKSREILIKYGGTYEYNPSHDDTMLIGTLRQLTGSETLLGRNLHI